MSIEFPCPTCRQLVRTPDAAAGKKGKCPTCGTVVIIPAPVTIVATTPPPQPPPPQPVANPPAATIEFTCPACQHVVRTPASAAGKKGKCPRCQAVVRIPGQREATPTLTPLPQAPFAPLATLPVLMPLPSAPANPFGGMGSFAPAPPASQTPIPSLAPLPADPLAGLPAANPLGIPPSKMGGTLNPYSSPTAAEYNQAAYQPRQITDRHRRGLPWEVDPSMDSFGDTMNLVLGSPQEAFQMMRRSGGVGNPMGFFIIGGVIGQIANAIYATIIRAIIFASAAGEEPFPFEVLLITGAIELIGGIFGVILSGVIGMFISAAIGHLSLMAVGGANAGYEATYRVLCFGAGSIAVLNAIPLIGPLIGMFYVLVVLIHGYTHAHEISGGKATLAVFLPLLVIPCLCCVPVGFLSLGGLLSCLGIQF